MSLEIPVFQYEEKDFCFDVCENSNIESKLDALLKEKWTEANKKNIFRYVLNIKEWKILEGPYHFLAQLNTDRAYNRRKPEDITSINEPFNSNRFNFTKLPKQEIYFDVGNGDGNDIIAANVSPVEWGHCLFIPERFHQIPQKMTKSSLQKVTELSLLSSSPNLRVVFNSLGAYASVNHLHWHLYYLNHRMLLETADLNHFSGPVFTLVNFPAKGFCIKLSTIPKFNVKEFINVTYTVIKFIQDKEIAHNVYITRAKSVPSKEYFDDVRIYIWARKSGFGIKDSSAFIPAVCELFGHLVIRTEEAYKHLTEEMVSTVLNDVTSNIFNSVSSDLRLYLQQYSVK